MLTIIESGSQAWALAAADGDLHIYAREEAGEWTEVLLSEDSEQIDQDGSSILEALYEQYAATGNGQTAAHDEEQDEPQDQEEPLEDEEDPADEEEPLEDEEEPADEEEPSEDEEETPDEDDEPADEEEKKPRRSRAKKK